VGCGINLHGVRVEDRRDKMMDRQKWHKSLTDERIVEACERWGRSLDDPGFCLACGNEQGGCEPDARRYRCEACNDMQVYGAEELLLSIDLV
jgi:hypothetical protein